MQIMTYGVWICVAGAVLVSILSMQDAYGHGVGYEMLPPIWLEDRQVSLEVSSSRYEDVENPDRHIQFALIDSESGITIRDVTYAISAYRGQTHLFDGEFTAKDGILIFAFEYADSETVLEPKKSGGFLSSIMGSEKMVRVLGKDVGSGGLYRFDVELLTAGSFQNALEPPPTYNVGISIPETSEWYVDDPNFGTNRIRTISYYDTITDFAYEPVSKTISFSMPFDWSVENINETTVVHEEFSFEKSFGDLLVSAYKTEVNGIALPESAVNMDDFTGNERIVHIVITQNVLLEMGKSQQDKGTMDFRIEPSAESTLSTVSENGQFRGDLWWESGSLHGPEAVFYFQIKDIFLKDRLVAAEYRFVLYHDGQEIFAETGVSLDEGVSVVRASIPDGVMGLAQVRFETLDGNKLARMHFPIIVGKDMQSPVPQWVKQVSGWWSEGAVSDDEFVAAMAYLVRNEIIRVSVPESEFSKTDATVPQWVKQVSGWWSEGAVSDDEFVAAMAYLIKTGSVVI